MIPTIVLESERVLVALLRILDGDDLESAELDLGDNVVLRIKGAQQLAERLFRLRLCRNEGDARRGHSITVELREDALLLVCGNVLGEHRCRRRAHQLYLPSRTRHFICEPCLALDPQLAMRAVKAMHPELTWADARLERAKQGLLRAKSPGGFTKAAARYSALLEEAEANQGEAAFTPLEEPSKAR